MAFMLAFLKVPLSWREILKRTFNEAFFKDNCLGMAAQLAYYFFFALFPALLFVVALASYFPVDRLIDDIIQRLGQFAPPEALSIITDQIRKISEGEEGGLLTVGMLITIWSSSAAMTAIIDTLNNAYDIEEGRPWWKVRLTAIGLTIGVSIFILVSFALVIVGPTMAEGLAEQLYLGPAFEWTWKILQWPVVFALASIGIALVYYFAPDADQDWVWLTPGSIVATILWLGASLGLKYYVSNFGNYTETYGVIGGMMVLLLWFYVSGLVILIGAELNAEIEHASPYGKDEGEKVPGEKRKIGPARMRAWLQHRARRHRSPRVSPPATAPGPDPDRDANRPAARAARAAPGNWPPANVIAMQEQEAHPEPPRRRRFSDIAIGLGVFAADMYWRARGGKRKTGA
jgi:membrane protein